MAAAVTYKHMTKRHMRGNTALNSLRLVRVYSDCSPHRPLSNALTLTLDHGGSGSYQNDGFISKNPRNGYVRPKPNATTTHQLQTPPINKRGHKTSNFLPLYLRPQPPLTCAWSMFFFSSSSHTLTYAARVFRKPSAKKKKSPSPPTKKTKNTEVDKTQQ